MSNDHIAHIKHVILDTCKLTDSENDGAGVLAIDNTNKVTRIPAGSTGQLLTYTGSNPYKISWQSSSASSTPQYSVLSSSGGGAMDVDSGSMGPTDIDCTKDAYAININSSGNFSNNLSNTGVISGHIIVFTIVKMTSGSRYRLYSTNTVFNGSGISGGGGPGYFEMDSLGQGVQLLYTEFGWAIIGGGGATPVAM
jgi:hypothetical protein